MTTRETQLKAYREYQEALQEAEEKKPEGSWCKAPADDGTDEAVFSYNPAEDFVELNCRDGAVRIQGKYLKSFQAALNDLMGKAGKPGEMYVKTI
jgi:hypothetical protein